MRRFISSMLAVLMLAVAIIPLLFGNGQVYADGIPKDKAYDIEFGETYTITWPSSTSQASACMKLSVPKDGKIRIHTSEAYQFSGYAYYDFALYKSDGITKVYDGSSLYQKWSVSFEVGLPAGVYYLNLLIYGYHNLKTDIEIDYTVSDYCEKEPNNTLSTATPLEDDVFYECSIGGLSTYEYDYYSFEASKGRCYRVYIGEYLFLVKPSNLLYELIGPGGEDLTFTRFPDSQGQEDYFYHISNNSDSSGRYYEFVPNKSGRYYLYVYNYPGNEGELPYKVKYKDMSPKVTINLNYSDLNLGCKKSITLNASITNSNSKPTWTSSDPSVATVDNNGKVTGKSLGKATITASVAGKKATCNVQVLYNDVMDKSSFWYEPTYALTEKGVVKGYDNQSAFKPGNDCTRAQMVTFLWRLNGEPKPQSSKNPFPDVKKGDYYYKAVLWAVGQGITTGYSDGEFKPQNVCTRAQTVTFLWRMAGKPTPKSSRNKFSDVKTSDYFYKAVLWASEKKIVAGYDDGTFQPQGKCLRRQMVTFLYKYDKYVNGKG